MRASTLSKLWPPTLLRPLTTIPRRTLVQFRVAGTGTGVAQRIAVPDTPHRIQTDAYETFGGANAAPSPLHYALSALSSCTQVTGSLVAKNLGVALGAWNVRVTGDLDPRVLATGAEGNANWSAVELAVEVQARKVGEEAFAEFARETERRCPVTQMFKRSGVAWKSNWTQL